MGDKTKAMGNQPTCDQNQHVTQTIPAPAPPESSRNKSIQEAMDKDLDGIADGYDHTKDFKENLKLCDPTKDYTKKDELGKGQFGTVYRVVHKQSKIEYAMKEISNIFSPTRFSLSIRRECSRLKDRPKVSPT